MPLHLTPKHLERLWSKVDQSSRCWIWTSAKTKAGYGVFTYNRKVLLAHRIIWELANGFIPDGLNVLHNCPDGDNPSCVNPAHLWLGTQRDNAFDMVAKGHAGCVRHPERVMRGSHHGNSKLIESQVLEIRRLYASGQYRQGVIAHRFGISRSLIQKIILRKLWTHV
jgi:hypothetical protein